jgi:hypothetical protein
MNAPGQEFLVGLRAISRVGPNGACGVSFVEQAGAFVACVLAADKTKGAVDRDVVLVAERRDRQIDSRRHPILSWPGLAELDRPARVQILLPELGMLGFPLLRNPALLRSASSRPRCCAVLVRRRGRRRQSARPWRLSRLRATPRKPLKQRLDRSGRGQLFAIQSNRAGVGYAIREAEPQEPHERQPVVDQEFRGL